MASRRSIWLKHYLNAENPETFLNGAGAARAAGYRASSPNAFASIGCSNLFAYKDEIEKWLDEEGMSNAVLKTKLLKLLNAKETKFFAFEGQVTDEREVDALETQRRSLDMAFKIKGEYAPEKREHSGPGGGPIPTANHTIQSDMTPKEAAKLYAQMIKGQL